MKMFYKQKQMGVLELTLTLGLLIGAGSSSAAEEKGLIGHWRFDEGKGNIAVDSSANDNNGTITNGKWVKGKVGGALELSGKNSGVNCGNNMNLMPSKAVTVEAWIKGTGTGNKMQSLINRSTYTGKQGYHLFIYLNAVLRFSAHDGENIRFLQTPKGKFIWNMWHHVAGVYDGSTYFIYLDGECVKSMKLDPAPIASCSGNLGIGVKPGYDNACFNGIIDEVKIYDRALSADEIKKHYTDTAEIEEI